MILQIENEIRSAFEESFELNYSNSGNNLLYHMFCRNIMENDDSKYIHPIVEENWQQYLKNHIDAKLEEYRQFLICVDTIKAGTIQDIQNLKQQLTNLEKYKTKLEDDTRSTYANIFKIKLELQLGKLTKGDILFDPTHEDAILYFTGWENDECILYLTNRGYPKQQHMFIFNHECWFLSLDKKFNLHYNSPSIEEFEKTWVNITKLNNLTNAINGK